MESTMYDVERNLKSELSKKIELYQKNRQAMFGTDNVILPKFAHLQGKFDELKSSVYDALKEYIYDQVFSYLLLKNDEDGIAASRKMGVIVSSKKSSFKKELDSGNIETIDTIIESIKDEVCPIYISYTTKTLDNN